MPRAETCDVVVIGSGFGGAVTALRLAEKGYDVVVLEQGRRLSRDELLAARSRVRSWLWLPKIGLRGFFWVRQLRHVGLIGAAGVGGGSLVWGAVLLQPGAAFFRDPAWVDLSEDWQAELEPHYREAERMLGRAMVPEERFGSQDRHLKAAAEAVGASASFGPVPLAVYFGDGPGVTSPDPFFDGAGPERTGCQLCGGCLVGCPYGAKNSLDLNYLYLAEAKGAQIRPLHHVDAIVPLDGGGYEVQAKHPWKRARQPAIRAQHVVLAGGVLGTLDLLLRCRDELGTLPNLSPRLGERVRTNSEAVTGILEAEPSDELQRGPSITSDFHPDATTHVTQNRYLGGGRLLRFQMGPMVDGGSPGRRTLTTLGQLLRHPRQQLGIVGARRFDDRYTALTVMQNEDSQLRITRGRGLLSPLRAALKTGPMPGAQLPGFVPVANAVTRAYAESSGGRPLNSLVETLGGPPLTAHILGGAVMGDSAETGVINTRHEVHGHPDLYVADASAIPANLGVNPSLSITAFAERFAAGWADAPGADERQARRAALTAAQTPAVRQQRPWSPGALQRRFKTLPAGSPEQLVGLLRAEFIGPRWLTLPAPLTVSLLGMPGWWGKRFALQPGGTVAGENLLERGGELHPSFSMTASVEPSQADGLPALVVRYSPGAPWPWRGVTDELRPLDADTFLGLTFGLPSPIRGGSPFLLRNVRQPPPVRDGTE